MSGGMLIRRPSALLCYAALLLPLPAGAESTTPDAQPTTSFRGTGLDGSEFDSSELGGRIVLLDFWGVWCPPCIRAFPKLSRLQDDYGDRGFQVLGLAVLSGTPEAVAGFLEEHQVTYPIVLIETEVADSYGVLSYPTYLLLGRDGEILERYESVPADLYAEVAADLEALLPAPVPDDPRGTPSP
jgi:thiol-disulfide isomerase/thioredoxin